MRGISVERLVKKRWQGEDTIDAGGEISKETETMRKKGALVQMVQKRVAERSIGFSTLRSQGHRNMPKVARTFLAEMKLDALDGIEPGQFVVWLDNSTKALVKVFQQLEQEPHWGAARKSINIFLENAFYDRILCKEYSLGKLESLLELPFDSNTKRGLMKDVSELLGKEIDKKTLGKWRTIRCLQRTDHREFQKYAAQVAEKKFESSTHRSRIYLDLCYWRSKREVD